MKNIFKIMVNQLFIIFNSKYFRMFLLSLLVLLFIFLSGITSRNFENGYILSVWGKDLPSFEKYFFKLYLSFIFLVLFVVVFPVSFAHHIHNITTTEYANIYLSRCFTRKELLIGTLLAFYIFYLMITILFVSIIIIYFWLITGKIILYMLMVTIPFLFLFLSSFTFLCLLVIITNSVGNATLIYVIYIFLISGLFVLDNASSNLIINIFSFFVPPISQTFENVEKDYLLNIIRSITSFGLSLFVSAFLFQRKEF